MLDEALTGLPVCGLLVPIAIPFFVPVPVPVPFPVTVPSYSGDCVPCPSGYLPPPSCELAGPPPARGLVQNGNTITTAGGYQIVIEGRDKAWSIYGPDGKKLTRVWGDPHVKEGDGDKWDFKDSSAFTLPDGTRIFARTAPSEKNKDKTYTAALDIANGNERVQISGIDRDRPVIGSITNDGINGWRTANGSPFTDVYQLQHDENNQEWVKLDLLRDLLFGSQDQKKQLLDARYAQPMRM